MVGIVFIFCYETLCIVVPRVSALTGCHRFFHHYFVGIFALLKETYDTLRNFPRPSGGHG